MRKSEETGKSHASAKLETPKRNPDGGRGVKALIEFGHSSPPRDWASLTRGHQRELSNRRADHVADGIVAKDLVPTTARERVVAPLVHYLSAHAAGRVAVPNQHVETAAQSDF